LPLSARDGWQKGAVLPAKQGFLPPEFRFAGPEFRPAAVEIRLAGTAGRLKPQYEKKNMGKSFIPQNILP
jgi:hypothetical protein